VPSVPPAEVILPSTKFEDASLRVKVKVAVSPDFNAEVEELMVMASATVSMLIES
jgi:hypothetical protein